MTSKLNTNELIGPGTPVTGHAASEKALSDRRCADDQCYMLLRDLVDSVGEKTLVKFLKDSGVTLGRGGPEVWLKLVKTNLEKHAAACSRFRTAVASLPLRPLRRSGL